MLKTSLVLKALVGVAVFASSLTVLLAVPSSDPSVPLPVAPRPTDPVAAGFTDWVEADLLPASPEWVTDAWDRVTLGDLSNYYDAYAGYFNESEGGLGELAVDLVNSEGAPYEWVLGGAVHATLIHELAHACYATEQFDFEYNATAVAGYLKGTELFGNLIAKRQIPHTEVVAEVAALHQAGLGTGYTQMTAWNRSKRALSERNYEIAESAQTAFDSSTALHTCVGNTTAADLAARVDSCFAAGVAARKARDAWFVADRYFQAVRDSAEHKWTLLVDEVNEAIANAG